MVQKELLTQKDYAAVGEEISHEMADNFTNAFKQAYPNENPGYHLGRNIIEKILAQPGCAGIRFAKVTEKGVVMSTEEGMICDLIGRGDWR